MKMVARLFVAVLVCLSCLGRSAFAGELLVVTDENLPPFSFVRDGKVVGVDVDMLRRAAAKAGASVRIEALPWKRVLHLLENGGTPWAMPLFRTPEREVVSSFIAPLHFSTMGVFVRRGGEFPFTSLDDLNGKRLGYNRGYALPPDLSEAVRQGRLQLEEVASTAQNVEKLLAGRIDCFVANVENVDFTLVGMASRQDVVLLPKRLWERRPAYLVIARAAEGKETAGTVASLRQALESLHRDGSYARILAQYTLSP
ncbi:transporter substrate-binding domain-containing protein [uncultured Propionivibrio sp.]|uniref:substrate-binding periplasmic protein n=1 Tax=uncultured Propionivibrio sp. TaxID=426737 RepID=UPI0029C0DC6E|nr:transporter substrate-binding domain-containing protein [uncultured Propionivibrio sp.]